MNRPYNKMEDSDSIDIYDENETFLGVSNRRKVHDDGLWHFAIHCWVYFEYNGETFIVFQKRQHDKRLFPGKYDVAAAGHYISGENEEDGFRELTEELKIPLQYYLITYYGKMRNSYKNDTIVNREIWNIYLCKLDNMHRLGAMDTTEIADLIFLPIESCMDIFSRRVTSTTAFSINKNANIVIQVFDFITEYNDYFFKIIKHLLSDCEA